MSLLDGRRHEMIAAAECERRGFQCLRPTAGNQKHWDLLVNGLRLQVKKRTVDATKPNNIRLVTNLSSSVAVYSTSDVDAFAIIWRDSWYVFLSAVIAERDGTIRNGLYMPRVAHHRGRWDVLRGVPVYADRQLDLFAALAATGEGSDGN